MQALALIILFIPYRRKELWAWAATWISIITIGLVIVFGADAIGLFYLATAAVMALARLATPVRFSRDLETLGSSSGTRRPGAVNAGS